MRNIRFFLSENFQFLVVQFSVYLNRHVFVMDISRNGLTKRIIIQPMDVHSRHVKFGFGARCVRKRNPPFVPGNLKNNKNSRDINRSAEIYCIMPVCVLFYLIIHIIHTIY